MSGLSKPSRAGITDITYADLLSKYNGSILVKGTYYRITDFRTRHLIPNGDSDIWTEQVEPLIVQATAINKLDKQAYSEEFPNDTIYYAIKPEVLVGPIVTLDNGDRGIIYYRKDEDKDISAYYDWRGVKFRRFSTGDGTTLTGTLDVVNGQNAVATSNDLTGQLAGELYIRLKGVEYAIQSVTATDIFLNSNYAGATETIGGEIKGNTLTGTIDVINLDPVVVGTGTYFTYQLIAGQYVNIKGKEYNILSVDNDTQITLNVGYQGVSESGIKCCRNGEERWQGVSVGDLKASAYIEYSGTKASQDYIDVYTFQNERNPSNCRGVEIKSNTGNNLLSYNVFYGSVDGGVFLSENAEANTFLGSMYAVKVFSVIFSGNVLGDCYNNEISGTNGTNLNRFGYFHDNKIDGSFSGNNGKGFFNNTKIGGAFADNKFLNFFQYNSIINAEYFSNNIFCKDVYLNTISNGEFGSNIFQENFQFNRISVEFTNNLFTSPVLRNLFEVPFTGNQITGGSTKLFNDNSFLTGGNTNLVNNPKFISAVISSDFYRNRFYGYFTGMTISTSGEVSSNEFYTQQSVISITGNADIVENVFRDCIIDIASGYWWGNICNWSVFAVPASTVSSVVSNFFDVESTLTFIAGTEVCNKFDWNILGKKTQVNYYCDSVLSNFEYNIIGANNVINLKGLTFIHNVIGSDNTISMVTYASVDHNTIGNATGGYSFTNPGATFTKNRIGDGVQSISMTGTGSSIIEESIIEGGAYGITLNDASAMSYCKISGINGLTLDSSSFLSCELSLNPLAPTGGAIGTYTSETHSGKVLNNNINTFSTGIAVTGGSTDTLDLGSSNKYGRFAVSNTATLVKIINPPSYDFEIEIVPDATTTLTVTSTIPPTVAGHIVGNGTALALVGDYRDFVRYRKATIATYAVMREVLRSKAS